MPCGTRTGRCTTPLPEPFWWWGWAEEDFASLTPELAQKYEQLFHQPEAFLKLGNRLLVLPVPDEPSAEKPRTKPPAERDR